MDEFWTMDQVAEYLKLAPRTIARMCARGELPAVKVANQWRIRKDLLDKYLDDQAKKALSPARELA